MEKTLSAHAEFELKKLGLHLDDNPSSKKILTDTIALVRRFEKQSHDEMTGKWVLEFFEQICNFLPLSPITDDPTEWEGFEDTHKNVKTQEEVVTKRWQNKRCPSIISTDGGKTFVDLRTNKSGESVDHIKQAEEWEAKRKEVKAARYAAEHPQKPVGLAKPPVDTSAPAAEEALAPVKDLAPELAASKEAK